MHSVACSIQQAAVAFHRLVVALLVAEVGSHCSARMALVLVHGRSRLCCPVLRMEVVDGHLAHGAGAGRSRRRRPTCCKITDCRD